MKQIIIEVSADGSLKIETKGFKGAECEKATKAMEEALGVASDRKKKPEFFQQTNTDQRA